MSCPTFVETGLEPESPRGRIYLIRAVEEGRIPLSTTVVEHLDRCLGCRNCEAVCPSGVPYGRILEGARAAIQQAPGDVSRGARFRGVVLRALFPHPRRIALLAAALRLYQRGGLRTLLYRSGLLRLLPKPCATWRNLRHQYQIGVSRPRGRRPRGGTSDDPRGILRRLIMPPRTPRRRRRRCASCGATARTLTPVEQVCCGALLVTTAI
jgi:glycolate oxidase iron-sulfur subunit